MNADLQLKLILRTGGNFDDFAIGDLVEKLAAPLSHWKIYDSIYDIYDPPRPDKPGFYSPDDASLRVEFERTHEWELILGLALIGSGFFAKSFCEELGKQLAQKLMTHLFPDGDARILAGQEDNSPSLLQGDDTKSVEKVAESLGVSQMANVTKIEIIRLIKVPGRSRPKW